MAFDRRFNLDDVAEKLLAGAKRAGADAADVVVAYGESLSVGARAGALEDVERAEGLDVGLRVLVDAADGRRQAVASASDQSSDVLDRLAESAVAMAREAPADPHLGLAPSELLAVDPSDLDLFDASEPPGPEALLEIALEMEAAALEVAGVSKAEGAGASWSQGEGVFATSDGFHMRGVSGARSIGISAIAGDGLGMERDHAYASARYASDLRSAVEVGREAGERAAARVNPGRPEAGRFPVIFDRRIASGVPAALAGALNGDAVARGSSFLADRMGERLLPEGVDLIDDPLLPRGMGSRRFDGEGVAGREKRLIADGVVSEWLLDLGAARKLGLQTNGSASRGAASAPRPGASNLRLSAGAMSRDALIGSVERGVLVTQTMGRGLNPVTGEYSTSIVGFWIEDGRIVRPVSEATIAGAALEMFPTLRAADDLRLERRVEAPTLLLEGLTIGAG